MAWAQQVDAHGGIDGHKIVVDRCNNQGSSTGTESCAFQQIQNSKVVAVEGFSPYSGQVSGPLYKAAGLTYATPFPVSDDDFVYDTIATTTGSLGSAGGLAYYLAKYKGLKRIADMRVDLASTDSYPALIKASIAAGSGGTFVADIVHPVTELDFTAPILQAKAAGAQVIFLSEEQAAIPAIFQAAVANGYQGAFALPPLHAPVVAAAAQTGVTVYDDPAFPNITTSHLQAITSFKAAMKAAGFTSDVDQGALSAYATGLLFEYAIQHIGPDNVTRSSFLTWVKTHDFMNVPLFAPKIGLPLTPKKLPGAINSYIYAQEFWHGTQPYVSGRFGFGSVLTHYSPLLS